MEMRLTLSGPAVADDGVAGAQAFQVKRRVWRSILLVDRCGVQGRCSSVGGEVFEDDNVTG